MYVCIVCFYNLSLLHFPYKHAMPDVITRLFLECMQTHFFTKPAWNYPSSYVVFQEAFRHLVSKKTPEMLQHLPRDLPSPPDPHAARQNTAPGVPAEALAELLAALEAEAQGSQLPPIPERDLRNLRKTFAAWCVRGKNMEKTCCFF